MELQVCYEKYKVEFGNEKWSHIDYSDGEACQAFYNKIQDFIEFSFIHLTRSILSGEYIREKNFGEILEKFKNELSDIPNPPSSTSFNISRAHSARIFLFGSFFI